MEYIIIILPIINLVFLYFFLAETGTGAGDQVLLEEQEDHLSDQLDYRFEQKDSRIFTRVGTLFWEIGCEVRTDLHLHLTVANRNGGEFQQKIETRPMRRMRQIQESMACDWVDAPDQVRKIGEDSAESSLQTSFGGVQKQLEILSIVWFWERCRQWLGMWAVSIGSFRPVALWASSAGTNYRRHHDTQPV